MEKKTRFIDDCFNVGINNRAELIRNMYISGMSCNEIAEWFYSTHKINVSSKGISYFVDGNSPHNNYEKITRSLSEAKRIAIKRGRMVYKKKNKEEKYHSKFISAGIRMDLLNKNNFKCELCGNGRHNNNSIEIHHKDFNEKNNSQDNYQVLCFLCHRGLHEIHNKNNPITTE